MRRFGWIRKKDPDFKARDTQNDLMDNDHSSGLQGRQQPNVELLIMLLFCILYVCTFYSAPRFQLIEQFAVHTRSLLICIMYVYDIMKLELRICRQLLLVEGKEEQRVVHSDIIPSALCHWPAQRTALAQLA